MRLRDEGMFLESFRGKRVVVSFRPSRWAVGLDLADRPCLHKGGGGIYEKFLGGKFVVTSSGAADGSFLLTSS